MSITAEQINLISEQIKVASNSKFKILINNYFSISLQANKK